MRGLVLLLAGAGSICTPCAQDALPPETILLSKVRIHAIENLNRQPNYTCIESVERNFRSSAAKKYQSIDTLRLEVALVNGKELFAWPGERKFDDTELIKMVPWGAIGNGSFALHARAIFEGQSATFKYRGEEPLGTRTLARFDYVVPLLMSGYKLHMTNQEAVVGYHGSVYADAKSLDIQRLEVSADDIPLRLGLSEATDRVQYARTPIGEGQFLLPEASELTLTNLDGTEYRNRVSFKACREFAGESVLRFDDVPALPSAPTPLAQIDLPGRISLSLSLMDDLNTRTAAIGDRVRARLQSDLKQNGRVLFPKGAIATGRISRLEIHDGYIVLGIEYSELESTEARARLNLRLEEVGGSQLLQPQKVRPPDPRPGEGILLLKTDRFTIMHGTLMSWRTIS